MRRRAPLAALAAPVTVTLFDENHVESTVDLLLAGLAIKANALLGGTMTKGYPRRGD